MNKNIITKEQKFAIVDGDQSNVTLDGKPACIKGYCLDFAMVRAHGENSSVDFSWPAVVRILANGGAFKS